LSSLIIDIDVYSFGSLLLQSLDVATSQIAVLEEYKNQYSTLTTEFAAVKSTLDETSSVLTATMELNSQLHQALSENSDRYEKLLGMLYCSEVISSDTSM